SNYFEPISKYFNNIKFLNYIRKSKFFDNLLAIWLIISFILLFLYVVLGAVPYYLHISIIMCILTVVIMFKPIKNYNKNYNQKFNSIKDLFGSSKNFKSFSLNEIFMVIFVIFILGMIVFLLILYEFGFLNGIPGLRYVSSFLIYLGLVSLFLIVFSFVLVYFENRVSLPLNRISVILNNYFEGKTISKEDNEYLENIPKLFNRETEISSLSRVLSKMNKDIDEYKENINDLTLEKEKIETELAIAHDIQDSFLPKEFDIHDDLDIFALMVPAKAVGGDFYDFFKIDDNHFAFLIGDVSDKGVPAALFMVKSIQLIKSKILSLYQRGISLEAIIKEVNNELSLNNESCMFVTSWIGLINLKEDKLTYVNAGHEFPIIKSNNKCHILESENDLVLGVMEDMDFHSHELDLNKSDRILLFTDGVTDANNINNEFFGVNRLVKEFENNNASVKDTIINIKSTADNFTQKQEQFDDFTILLLEYKS
ncbi:MAG: PP2C family protein-serine/threonine phosphatase, partial [Methanobacteriaceae archaeon]|nr:PP2C family protein-serine/threonine phosphatase [Methanobacteriaceae archaeon]